MYRHATAALRQIYRPGFPYSKCGFMLAELMPEGSSPPDPFDPRNADRRQKLMTALDAINGRMGHDTVFYAGSRIRRDWAAAAHRLSRHHTTDWTQVLRVTA